MDRHLSPQEVARRFGVSIKALRLYERHGLLTPLRSQAGWRTYGPDQIARLHQILALKRLGLSLAQIGEILAGGADKLDAILALQESDLSGKSRKFAQALALVRAARRKLKTGQALSLDDLANLTAETKMDAHLTGEQVRALLAPYTGKHLSGPQQKTLERLRKSRAPVVAAMERLFDEAAILVECGSDPASPAGLDLVRRWRIAASEFQAGVSGMQDIALRIQDAWAEAMKDPEMAAKLARRQEVQGFIRDAWMRLRFLEESFHQEAVERRLKRR
jgi:DNA-binding transcriptional MerR regulator